MTSPQQRTIGVVGAGRWGTTLAHVATKHDRNVLIWSSEADVVQSINDNHANPHLPELETISNKVSATTELGEIAEACHLILIADAAKTIRETARGLGKHIDGSHCVVHALRGLEPNTLTTPSQVIEQETCAIKIGAFIGPARVADLLAGTPNAAVVASRFPQVISETQDALACDVLRVYSNRDLLGVETAASASAVIAFAIGVCLELNLGPAALALLTTRGVAEISRLCKAIGGQERTAFGLSGLGDVLVARESNTHDVEAGRRFARGQGSEALLEALGTFDAHNASQTLSALAAKHGIEAHITGFVYAGLFQGMTVGDGIQRLMSLRQMEE